MKKIWILSLFFCLPVFLKAQFISCNDSSCGTLEPSWRLVGNSESVVCEGESFSLSPSESTPADNIAEYRWIIYDSGFTILLDTTFNDTTNLEFLFELEDFEECSQDSNIVGFQVNLIVTSFECDEGVSCRNSLEPLSVKLKPRAKIDDTPLICEDEPFMLVDSSCYEETYLWEFPDGSTSTLPEPEYTFLDPGEYEITLTTTNSCGVDTDSHSVEVIGFPEAIVAFDQDPSSGCIDLEVAFENNSQHIDQDDPGEYSWVWQVFGPPMGAWEFADSMYNTNSWDNGIEFTELGEYQVYLIVENLCGIDTAITTITAYEEPYVNLDNLGYYCEVANIVFANYATFGGTVDEVVWEVTLPDGSVQTFNGLSATANFTMPGNYEVEVSALSNNCDDDSDDNNFFVEEAGPADLSAVPDEICPEDDPFTLIPNNGTWTCTPPGPLTGDVFDPGAAVPGTVYTLSFTPSSTCAIANSTTITVLDAVQVTVESDIVLCEDLGVYTLSANPVGGEWSDLDNIITTDGTINTLDMVPGTYSFLYTYMDTNGCVIERPSTLTLEGAPEMVLDDLTVFCETNAAQSIPDQLQNFSVTPTTGDISWTGPGIVDEANGLFNPGLAGGEGFYTIYVNYMLEACVINDSLIIEVIPQTSADAGVDTTLCISDGTYFLAGSPGGGCWVEIGGSGGAGLTSCTGELNLALAGDGSHTYEYTIFANTSCEQTDQVMVNIVDLTAVYAGSDSDVCVSETTYTLTGFSPAGGTWSGPGIIDSDLGIVDIQSLPVGTYTLSYAIEDNSIDCAASDDMLLHIRPLPIPAFSVNGNFCVNEPIDFINNSVNAEDYIWNFGNGASSTNANEVQSFDTAGYYIITLTAISLYDCEDMITDTIYISEPPTLVAFEMDTVEGCAALDILFTNMSLGEDITYIWDFGNGQTSTATDPGIITFEQGTQDTTYYITLSVANGCGGETFIDSVLVHPQPVAVFGTNFNSYCSGDTVFLANVSYGDPLTYYWDFGNGIISSDSLPLDQIYFTDSIPAVITITLITENLCGVDTTSREVVINPTNVNAFFNTDPTMACVGDTISFTSFATLGADIVWHFGDGNISNEQNPQHTYQLADTFEVIQYVYGCGFDSITTEVIIEPIPDVGFTSNEIVCLGDTLFFENLSDGSVVLSEWIFGDASGVVDTLTHPFYVYDAPGLYNVELTGTTLGGCNNTVAAVVEVLTPPAATMLAPDSVCVGEAVIFTNTSIGNISSCFWSFGDGETSGDCITSHEYAATGLYTVSLEITNSDGCKDTINQLVYVRPTPQAAFTVSLDNLCSPAIATFTNLTADANSYLWDFGDDSTSTMNTPLPHVYDSGGIYVITLTAYFDGICTNVFTQTIEVYQTPVALYSPLDTSGCAEFELSFSNLSIGDDLLYNWDLGGGIFSNDESPDGVYPLPGEYSTSLIVATANCQDTIEGTVTVFKPVEATYSTVDVLCNGESTGAIDVEIIDGTEPYEYTWSTGSIFQDINEVPAGDYLLTITDSNNCMWDSLMTIEEPPAIAYDLLDDGVVTCHGGDDGYVFIEATGGTPGYTYLWDTGNANNELSDVAAGEYMVTITDANGCTFTEVLTVDQNDLLQILPSVEHISCAGFDDGQIFVDSILGGFGPYYASVNGPGGYFGEGISFTNLMPGNYTFTIMDSLDCIQTQEVEVIEPVQIFIDIEEDTFDIQLGETIELLSNYNASNPVFEWIPVSWLSCIDCPSPFARPWDNVIYEVLMTDEFGCLDTDSVVVIVSADREIYIPDGFTPNSDNVNDVFTIRTGDPGVKEVLEFKVFDRWGEMLFQAKNFQPNDTAYGWDGTFRGQVLDPGVYTYYAEIEFIDNEIEVWKGDITLLR